MKKKFSIKWKSSKQKRKKRKYLANAPLPIRHRLMSANLSKELRKKYSRRSFPIRKNDVVKVMRGSFKGKTGKIVSIDLSKLRVTIEGLQRQKKDGTKINVYFKPSNLQITELDLDDKKRVERLKSKVEKEKAGEDKISKEENKEEKNVLKKK